MAVASSRPRRTPGCRSPSCTGTAPRSATSRCSRTRPRTRCRCSRCTSLRDDAGPARQRPRPCASTSAAAGDAVAVVTHVRVDLDDPAFGAPDQADRAVPHRGAGAGAGDGARLDGRGGLRPRLPPGRPVAAAAGGLEVDAVRTLLDAGHVVLAAGGGGVAVAVARRRHHAGRGRRHRQGPRVGPARDGRRRHRAVPAHRGRLRPAGLRHPAAAPGAPADRCSEAEQHLADGQFPPGSMGPKVGGGAALPAGRGAPRHHHLRRGWLAAAAGGRGRRGTTDRAAAHRGRGGAHERVGMRVLRDSYVDSMLLMLATASMDARRGRELGRRHAGRRPRPGRPCRGGFTGGELDGPGRQRPRPGRPAPATSEVAQAALDAGREARFSEQQARAAACSRAAGEHRGGRRPAGGAERRDRLGAGGVRRARGAPRADGGPARPAVQRQRAGRAGGRAQGAGRGAGAAGHGTGRRDGGPGRDRARLRQRAGRHRGPRSGSSPPPAPARRRSRRCSTAGACGVSQVVGVGGRDLSEAVGGRMAQLAARALDADAGTAAVLLVSKPPSPAAAAAVLAECASTPAVAVFLGLTGVEAPDGVAQVATLEQGALAAARLTGATPPTSRPGWPPGSPRPRRGSRPSGPASAACSPAGPSATRRSSCSRALLGPVYSNEPLRKENTGVPAPEGAHVLLDLGAEEFTLGRPHPMIDPSSRLELLRAGREPDVAVVLMDVVLGHGAHEDPAGQLAPVCAELTADGGPVGRGLPARHRGRPAGLQPPARACSSEAGCLVARDQRAGGATPRRRWHCADRSWRRRRAAAGPLLRPVALLTYSTKPRGGVVHTLALAEALLDLGVRCRWWRSGSPAAPSSARSACRSPSCPDRSGRRRWRSASPAGSTAWKRTGRLVRRPARRRAARAGLHERPRGGAGPRQRHRASRSSARSTTSTTSRRSC